MITFFITCGCGFIGSNFFKYILNNYNAAKVINLDKLTFAGNPLNLNEFNDDERYTFYHVDICDHKIVEHIFKNHQPQYLINFAAESHVDKSIGYPNS